MSVILDERPVGERGVEITDKETKDRERVLTMFHAGIDMILAGKSAGETLEYTGEKLKGIRMRRKS
jgi:hypothetical protein